MMGMRLNNTATWHGRKILHTLLLWVLICQIGQCGTYCCNILLPFAQFNYKGLIHNPVLMFCSHVMYVVFDIPHQTPMQTIAVVKKVGCVREGGCNQLFEELISHEFINMLNDFVQWSVGASLHTYSPIEPLGIVSKEKRWSSFRKWV